MKKKDIIEYIDGLREINYDEIYNSLKDKYKVDTDYKEYILNNLVTDYLNEKKQKEEVIILRKQKLVELKKLKLPEQRSEEWYEIRKKILTASSLGSAIDKCHFQSRDELILSKIENQPFKPNPITEWGVKYEDVAIMFYEELYNTKVLDFGLIPHPDFSIFGASPDGICDDTGNDEYVSRMVEIKCPPKRKFTKSVPPHYLMQVHGQLEVCDLDECDFFQVKFEEYENNDEYKKDIFMDENDGILSGRTNLNYPKGVVITLKVDDKLSYLYSKLNQTDEELNKWIEENKKNHENIFEIKWWKIIRYECTIVHRDKKWWNENLDKILDFYEELQYYKNDVDKIGVLKDKIKNKKKSRRDFNIELDKFMLISDEEDNIDE
jgi:putative phage-type endonuclease